MKHTPTFCSGCCSVSASWERPDVVTATPTRHFLGSHKFTRCDMHGATFQSSDAAFAAMHEHGYGEQYFHRRSVPSPVFSNSRHIIAVCKFDALYRFLKHERKAHPNREHPALRKELALLAADVRYFHPVSKAIAEGRNSILK